ncbi:hypothetical protein ACLQ28_22140 [Micromonospora sp. DT201]|uniref:hypothetical protein n=1 Tax=Micromonospora sp. DT201 TaxID=3393442 RepID=UPI003CF49BD2
MVDDERTVAHGDQGTVLAEIPWTVWSEQGLVLPGWTQDVLPVRVEVTNEPFDEGGARCPVDGVVVIDRMGLTHKGGESAGVNRDEPAWIPGRLPAFPGWPGVWCCGGPRQSRGLFQERGIDTHSSEVLTQPGSLEIVGALPGPDESVVLAGWPRLVGTGQVVADVGDEPDLGKVPIGMLRAVGPRRESPDLDHRG